MRNITEHNITEAVVARFEACTDPRLKQVLGTLVRHLHAFVRETGLTEAEWMRGIRFLTEAGHITDDKRQEFILLSDVLGVSMLTVAQNNANPPGATESTVFGPFHVAGAPRFAEGADIAAGAPGVPLFVRCSVRSLDGLPLAGATVDVWQSDEEGFYDVQRPELAAPRARGVFVTDAAGRFSFRSITPVAYPIPTDGPVGQMLVAGGRHPWRPAHVHFMIEAPGHETLITHVFRAGDPYLDSDVVFGVRASLVAEFPQHPAGTGPHGAQVAGPYHTLDFDFVLNPKAAAGA
jgi:hydroxyquinol 1,2-dioxygenase